MFQSLLIHPPEPSDKYQQRHIVAKQEYLGKEMAGDFAGEVYLLYSEGIFNMP